MPGLLPTSTVLLKGVCRAREKDPDGWRGQRWVGSEKGCTPKVHPARCPCLPEGVGCTAPLAPSLPWGRHSVLRLTADLWGYAYYFSSVGTAVLT